MESNEKERRKKKQLNKLWYGRYWAIEFQYVARMPLSAEMAANWNSETNKVKINIKQQHNMKQCRKWSSGHDDHRTSHKQHTYKTECNLIHTLSGVCLNQICLAFKYFNLKFWMRVIKFVMSFFIRPCCISLRVDLFLTGYFQIITVFYWIHRNPKPE